MKVVLAGGSGFLGSALGASLLRGGCEVVVLTRGGSPIAGARAVIWDAREPGAWTTEVAGCDAVVNLAGAPMFTRWGAGTLDRIRSSRVDATRAVGLAIADSPAPPPVWINASAVGYYGHTDERVVDETAPAGHGPLADTCGLWEEACLATDTPATRTVRARMGVVLSRTGGAFPVQRHLARAFLGGHLGSGRQGFPWVHVRDAVAMLRWAIEHPVQGPMNVVAPDTVSSMQFMALLRKRLGRPWCPPVPALALRLAHRLGAPPPEVLLDGQYALPKVALDQDFRFRFATLDDALRDLV